MNKTIFFVVLLFLFIGVAVASEDANTTDEGDTLSISEDEPVVLENSAADTIEKTSENEVKSTAETPTITTSAVKGTAGKTITLKATVKNSSGAISGIKVTFTLNGKTYTAKSNSNGVASVSVKCPASAVCSAVTKYNSKKLTKTTKYSKTYSAKASTDDGASSTFKVTSKKSKVVKKYKVKKKKTKTTTIKLKKGENSYKKGKYAIVTSKNTKNGYTYLAVAAIGKLEAGYLKFHIKEYYKQNGKYVWNSWYKVPKNKYYTATYLKSAKLSKIKVKYTKTTYKKV